ncbi:ribose transport system permease protein [Amycolatopsis bartoniae]|uniref:Sugar transporter permease n=1 Tax=Amycolatopsis bartoniae TaxID=941986 RepID=A0A8H9J1L1_9PSEU|nr:ABC transporter permease [Amycolatopsis bartoniae]MBB2936325.1 ribose transport system permease protein [Amycolatopsis bartoniae]TVS99794.1 ABC transporter permease [Amycolatopsis bartoniae]GHF85292.1 sugar transporter permease [Amycolatopsis bartoniae]
MTAELTGVPARRHDVLAAVFRFQSLFGLVLVFLAAVVYSPSKNGHLLFLDSGNLFNVVRSISEIGILAVGMTLVILIGGIDLSVGSVLGLASVGSAVLLVNNDLGVVPVVLAVLAIGLGFGLLQGIAVSQFKIQAFIVTLAGMQIARGLARIWSGGQGITITYGDAPGQAPVVFSLLGERTFDGVVPIPALIFVVVAALAVLLLRVSAFSRHVYAIGGNEKAARLSGVPVRRVKIVVFGVCGLLAALAGIVHAGQLNFGGPNDGAMYELDAIAAVVIGGTSLSGGRGSVVGTVAGALLVGVLRNILALNNVDSNVQLLVIGLVIVLAAGLQRLRPASVS